MVSLLSDLLKTQVLLHTVFNTIPGIDNLLQNVIGVDCKVLPNSKKVSGRASVQTRRTLLGKQHE